ncbi:MAG: biopolymer transporter ExbD [Bacteroidales bacterium]|jgi:biopolymer transport protein ExbD|nr:biopolymer transporter ExbD [Bacteroidales bacterium]
MSRFRKEKKKEVPALNTSSMSDIIFMFLFFFMVITTIREATLFVKVQVPAATEIQKLERKNLVSYIYIGTPINIQMYGSEPRIQLNDQFGTVEQISAFIESERAARPEQDRPFLITSLKVDKDVRMGIVTDVKQELRKVGAYKINYSANKTDNLFK